jgi:hypothetical protein
MPYVTYVSEELAASMLRVDREEENNKFLRNLDDVLLLNYRPRIPEVSNL